MTALKLLPLVLLACGCALPRALGADHNYILEFEISKIDLQTANRIRNLGNEFKSDLTDVVVECFGACDVRRECFGAVVVNNIYYTKLVDGVSSNALEVHFTMTGGPDAKPSFQTGEFMTKMMSSHGITVKSARLDGDVVESASFEVEGEPEEAEETTLDRPLSRQMSRIFAIIGIIFIFFLLIAGYVIDWKSAKSASKGLNKD